MSTGKLKIHSENILPIIKKWLYSEKDIFVRELISNSCDAIRKLQILRDQGVAAHGSEELRIDLIIDKEQRALKFVDTGIGMTQEEVENYIAQIAFSGAEAFVSKYQSANEKDQIIGHFGLGFYSAYMVAERVTIDTLSFQEGSQPVLWSCDGSSEYTVEKGTRTARGTEITLYLSKESDEFLEESALSKLINRYCRFLPYPIYLNGTIVNHREPLWLKPALDCTEKEYIDFFRQLYPGQEDPLFWVHLSVDYPFHLKGILYFPKMRSGVDLKKNQLQLFCNRVFVSDNCQDLLPDYLGMLQGAIDSPDIPLNVSRSYLQMDRTVRQLAGHISKKVADRLATLFNTDRKQFETQWPHIGVIVKLGALHDEKFYERVKDLFLWQNNRQEWVTLTEYLERNRSAYDNKVFYANDPKQASPFLQLYEEKKIEVLFTDTWVDTALVSFLESKIQPAVAFQRIDGAIDPAIIDPKREKTLLDQEGKTVAAQLAQFVKTQLSLPSLEVEAKSLASDSLPGFILIDEKERRMRDYLRLQHPEMSAPFNPKHTFVVNTNSKLLNSIEKIAQKDPDLSKEMLLQVYQLALLAQQEFDPATINSFVTQSTKVLEKLAAREG